MNNVGCSRVLAEADGDGFSNLAEYLAGTDPGSALSALRMAMQRSGVLGWTLEFDEQRERGNEVLAAPAAIGPWIRIEEVPAGAGARIVRVDLTPQEAARFFQIRLLP